MAFSFLVTSSSLKRTFEHAPRGNQLRLTGSACINKVIPLLLLPLHPLTTRPDNKQQNLSDEHVRFVVNHAVPVALDVNTIRRATQDDPTCQKLIELLQNNSWNSLNTNNLHPEINTAELRAYELLKQELSLTPEADLIIRGNRLVMPTKLRQQVTPTSH